MIAASDGAQGSPQRIVSLVPSLTETIFHYGLGDRLVGRTRYCIEPVGTVDAVEAVGGTKNPDVERIIELAPDLIVVNKEENRIEDCRAFEEAGLRVHVTHPCTVEEAVSMLVELGEVLGATASARALAAECRSALERADGALVARKGRRARVFCPIWRNPWMTFRDATYIGDVLRGAGGENVFGTHEGTDFFEVTLEEVRAARPDIAVLPSEPYVFGSEHALELGAAGIDADCVLVDGMDLAWYGPRIPAGLDRLRVALDEACWR